MTLRELHQRLAQIVEENERKGKPEYNDLHAVVCIERGRNNWYIPVNCVWAGRIALDGDVFSGEIVVREYEAIKMGRREK